MVRELLVLGTASRAPTRTRNHNGYLLRFDAVGLLFDPGEGAQRQLLLTHGRSSQITHILLTHEHLDHCLGLPGVLLRMTLDQRRDPVEILYPDAAAETVQKLLDLAWVEGFAVQLRPLDAVRGATVALHDTLRLDAVPLEHRVPTLGYRLVEPDDIAFDRDRLEAHGLSGPIVGQLRREGSVLAGGRQVMLADVTVPLPGQRVAFVMDTRLCSGVSTLLDRADLAVVETTFRDGDEELAERFAHMTTGQAAAAAAAAGVRRLVLTHYSARYADEEGFAEEARRHHDDVVAARDLATIPVPPRRHVDDTA